jgi:hypothetical protein
MIFSAKQWVEIAIFPVCSVQALEQVLVEKELQQIDLQEIDILV